MPLGRSLNFHKREIHLLFGFRVFILGFHYKLK
jgi:hypothetical protein